MTKLKIYKVMSITLLFLSIILAYMWYDTSKSQPIDSFAVQASSSAVKELPRKLEDVKQRFNLYHTRESGEQKNFQLGSLLSDQLMNLHDQTRLFNTAQRSSLLNGQWFREYTESLRTLDFIITEHSVGQTENENRNVEQVDKELSNLISEITKITSAEDFSVADEDVFRSVTGEIQEFNQNFQ
ncbi:hypothetical protein SAMN05216353_13212 [Halobacillus alkaliphilus]|uniref:Uncharacterized protein n=1 Tax=Halobacillus alkaliphilus TaxID=396056 RepID=A0A1I2QPX7_9BACI|nr:hypothetical protein [Halobacillus alkaliphilus]SFG28307.1 hypothetical protein SAMN05216353_13212 [Halobacillus alkaliphilus]